ncbi:MAG: hypothetical protein WC188_03965 [Candidatus Caldatribacteriota bacterium]|jgi:hypothetical protein|nr:hypothetical protein [Patescibacteria group bacterium]
MDAQHWNDILDYVKLNLGVPINLLEINDTDLITHLRKHVLTLFSQTAPAKKFAMITSSNIINSGSGGPRYMYKIPVPEGTYIVDILEAMPTKEVSIVDMYGGALISAQAAMDLVISNSYIDAVRSLQVRQTWEFLPPDVMIFDQEITACAVIYNTQHEVLNTIRPDLYHRCFKPMCLGYTKLWIAAMRSKFEGLATPFGALNLNFNELKTEGQQAIDSAQAILDTIPPDILIEIC